MPGSQRSSSIGPSVDRVERGLRTRSSPRRPGRPPRRRRSGSTSGSRGACRIGRGVSDRRRGCRGRPSRRASGGRTPGRGRRPSGHRTSAAAAAGTGVATTIRSRSSRRSRSVRMFGAMPDTASPSSLNRRGPSSSASTISRLQRSPTRSRAASRGDGSRRTAGSAMGSMVGAGSGLVTARCQ